MASCVETATGIKPLGLGRGRGRGRGRGVLVINGFSTTAAVSIPRPGFSPAGISELLGRRFVDPNVCPPWKDFWTFSDPYEHKATTSLVLGRAKGTSRFWLQNAKEEEALKAMVLEMTEWYNNYWEKSPKMKKDDIIVRGFYAAYYDKYKQWFRVRILDVIPAEEEKKEKDPEFNVHLIDFGNVIPVSLDCIHPLRKKDTELHIQAVPTELYDESEWTPFTEDEEKKLLEFMIKENCGRLEVLAVGERWVTSEILPVASVIFVSKSCPPGAYYEELVPNLFTLDGRLKFNKYLADLKLHCNLY